MRGTLRYFVALPPLAGAVLVMLVGLGCDDTTEVRAYAAPKDPPPATPVAAEGAPKAAATEGHDEND